MSDMTKEIIDTLIEGGKATPGPTLAPRLSMMKVNIQEVFKKINEKTKDFAGMKVPIKIIIDKESKETEIEVGTPPMPGLIKKEIGIEKAKTVEDEKKEEKPAAVDQSKAEEKTDKPAKTPAPVVPTPAPVATESTIVKPKERIMIGNITIEQCVKIAKMKMDSLLAKNLKAAVKQVVGTCQSMNGIMVEGIEPKKIIKEIDEAKYDSQIK